MEAVGGVGRTRNSQTFLFGALERDGGKLAVLGAGGLARRWFSPVYKPWAPTLVSSLLSTSQP